MNYPLTKPQNSIWLTEQYYKNTNINNVCGTFYSTEILDFDLLKKSLNIFLKNNDSFKIKLKIINDEVVQYFSDIENIDFKFIDISTKEEQLALEHSLSSIVFNMIESLLFEIILFRYPNGSGGFIINSHHIISDSWTNGLVANTVALIYSKLKNNEEYIFDNSLSYKNYIQSELDYINSSKFNKDKEYWNSIFSTVPEIATFPSIKTMPKEQNELKANRLLFNIDKELFSSLKFYCERNKVSLYNFFMTIFSLYLGRISNLSEFIIGTPILNRSNFKEKQTTGMFINTLPLKVTLSHDKPFLDNLKNITINSTGLLRHQKYSFQYIIEDLRKKEPSLPRLYNVLFSYQTTKMNENMDALEHTTSWNFNETIDDDLDIHMFEWNDNNSIQIAYDYRLTLYDKKYIENLHSRILHIINQILENENILLKDIEIVTEEEKTELMNINNIKIDYPKNLTIIDLFKKQVQNTPNDIAISFEGTEITYKDLDLKSDKVASFLMVNGIKKADIVGIFLPRSLDFFVSMLGILKVGAIYMPMDVDFPDTRIEYMLKDSAAMACITTEEYEKRISIDINKITIRNINNSPKTCFETCNLNSSDGCYVIYTSGSTGNPKGVIATHSNVVNYTYAFQHEFNLNKQDTVLQQFTPSFDAFVEEFYPALLNGIKIFAVSKDTIYNFKKFENFIKDNKITLISCSPLLLNELNKLNKLKSVKTFISGGDVLKKEYYSNLIKYATVYNTYGPTETTVCSTYHKCSPDDNGIIPIGKTIANYKNYIVSDDNILLPKGFVGELCIGGNGVSLGYLNNKDLTKEKFITLFGERVYKTGDLCRINDNNEIEFLGRKDNQLKIRGFRVSLGEIEKMINQYPGISNSLVLDFTDEKGNKKLCAYYIGLSNITTKEIKEYLEKVLPTYMIPSLYIRIDSIPTNINGKVDKAKLPNASDIYLKRSFKYIKPSTKTEQKLEDVWKNILGLKQISIEDNLFDLGADSLSIIEFQTLIVNENWDLDTQEIYIYPTIKKLSERIEKKSSKKDFVSDEKYKQISIPNLCLKNTKNVYKNILLTGATGFLGIHILNNLLENTDFNIYCLVRGENGVFAKKRLVDLYNFYFNKNLLDQKERIKIIYGDITKDNFNINEEEYQNLLNIIDLVIHSAATVKHYGNETLFKEINVVGTQKIIDFCLNSNSELHHISTISVSGQITSQDSVFTEKDFYIGQNYSDNVYIKSKFEAEYCVLNSIRDDNLYAKLYRVGNLTGRYSDGLFQKNIKTNAFYKNLQKIIETKKLPSQIKDVVLDFSPVDLASCAIKKLVFEDTSGQIIYHIYNNHTLSIEELICLLNSIGINIEILLKENFFSETEQKEFRKLIRDLQPFANNENITVTNNMTVKTLQKLNFNWNKVNKEYIAKIINYMRKVKFLKEDELFE